MNNIEHTHLAPYVTIAVAKKLLLSKGKASVADLQIHFRIGHKAALDLMHDLEHFGYVTHEIPGIGRHLLFSGEKNTMSVSALFNDLGAPLHNHMWSWGAVRQADSFVFLRVWQDGTHKFENGRYYTWVSDIEDTDQSNGANERRDHVKQIRAGSRCYMVMCDAVDDEALVRKISGFNENDLFIGGQIIEHNGGLWIENLGRTPLRQLLPR